MINSELEKVADQLGLTYNAKDMIAIGQYRGYKIVIKENSKEGSYSINFPMRTSRLNEDEGVSQFIAELLQESKKVSHAIYRNNSLKVDLIMKSVADENITNMIELLVEIEKFASENFYQTCCEMCTEDNETEIRLIKGQPIYVCEDCYRQTIQNLESRPERIKQKGGNFITGIVGAFLGSLIGVVVWVIIYSLGYIAAIAGIILAVCIIKGYQLFGGKLNILGIVITIGMTIGMVYVSTYIAYGYDLYTVVKEQEQISLIQAIKSLGFFLKEYEEVRLEFIKDLLLGYLFTAIGSVSTFISAYKASNHEYSAQRMRQ